MSIEKMIASLSNEKIKDAVAIKNNHGRYRNDAFFIEGTRLFTTALDAGVAIQRVFFTYEFALKDANAPVIERLNKLGLTLDEVSPMVMEKLSDTQTPQGIAGIGARKNFSLVDIDAAANPQIVICDGMKDPGNLGAIIRTAEAFATDTIVILPNTSNPYAPKAIRASAGGIFNLAVVYATAKQELASWLKDRGIRLIVTVPEGGMDIRDIDMASPFAVVLGSEAVGASPDIIKMADVTASIPMRGITGSLNAAAAAAVFLYESFRKRH
ncbi:MAG: RNA methyltransferase [Nitrospirae bacterium]|nr:RNA methyltransferase [Nitrospirota bacterium]